MDNTSRFAHFAPAIQALALDRIDQPVTHSKTAAGPLQLHMLTGSLR